MMIFCSNVSLPDMEVSLDRKGPRWMDFKEHGTFHKSMMTGGTSILGNHNKMMMQEDMK